MPTLPGPLGPIPFTRDELGYPKIQARNRREAAFAIGWMHATDRLLQVQLAALLAEGRAMEVAGSEPFAKQADRASRTLRLTEGLEDSWRDASPGLVAWVEAYCAGFRRGAESRGLPLALRALGLPVQRWTPLEVLKVYRFFSWFGLTSVTQLYEVAVAELLARGVDVARLEALLGVDGLDAAPVEGVRWPTEDALLGVPVLGGSNAVAISGSHTASGSAVLMGEFHLEIGKMPPVGYAVDVRFDDGSSWFGITMPGAPYLVAGRTGRVAWTYTFGHGDAVDVMAVRMENGQAVDGEARHPVRAREEVVRSRTQAPETWTFWDLPGGASMLWQPPRNGTAMAVRWRGMRRDIGDHEALLSHLDADGVHAQVEAHRGARTMSTGAVFADAEGHIAAMQTAVIGAGGAQAGPTWWSAERPDASEEARPVVIDPPEGFVVAANAAVPGWTVGAEPSYRHRRLEQLAREGSGWDLASAWAIPDDEYDPCAARLMAVWAPLLPGTPALQQLSAWSRHQRGGSGEGVHRRRFHALHFEATRAVMARVVGRAVASKWLDELGLLTTIQPRVDDVLALQHPELMDADELRIVLDEAWDAVVRLGAEGVAPGFVSFVDMVADGALPSWTGFATQPFTLRGGPTSLQQVRWVHFRGHPMLGGPAFRVAMDLGENGGLYNVAGGASERRFGPGYGVGIDLWAQGVGQPFDGGRSASKKD